MRMVPRSGSKAESPQRERAPGKIPAESPVRGKPCGRDRKEDESEDCVGRKKSEPGLSMKLVGSMAGVSAMTVSRALRNPDSVSDAVRERIRAVIDKLGYVPNRVAGSLSSNRSTQVALVVPSLRTAIHAEMIQGISDVLRQHHFQLMISDCGNSMELEEEQIRAYVAQRVCGVILHNTRHSEGALRILAGAGVACVETGDLNRSPIDSVVSYSNAAAGAAMAQHLLAAGYRRMAFASLPVKNRDRIRAMRRGFVTALRKADAAVPPELLLEVGPGLQSGARALSQILEIAPRTQAVLFAGDVLAAGAVFECQRRGIAIPKRMAIANSDDSELLQNTVPSVTAIQYPRYDIGVRAARIVIERALGTQSEASIQDVGFVVAQREST
jgi:LacI family gluconate utilization system Gnt-I transcriptional repressor